MPNSLNKVAPHSCFDQLVAYLKNNSDIEILDVRPTLLKEKAVARNYHKTDTHWNAYGAFVAYQQIMQQLSKDLPDLQTKMLDDFNAKKEIIEGQDLAGMMGLRNAMYEQNLQLEPKEKCARSVEFKLDSDKWPTYPPGHEAYVKECRNAKLNLVFFQDSFGTGLAPFISEHFRQSVFIWDYPNRLIMTAAVRELHPDVVIEERVERHLKPMLPDFDVPSDLVGGWKNGNSKVWIKHSSTNKVYLINEHGSQTSGLIENSRMFVNEWGITGNISVNHNEITWSNGSIWLR